MLGIIKSCSDYLIRNLKHFLENNFSTAKRVFGQPKCREPINNIAVQLLFIIV